MNVKSMIDDDLYKFTMQQIAFHRFSNVNVSYKFLNRKDTCLIKNFDKIKEEINNLNFLKITEYELEKLRLKGFFKDDYLEFLRNFRLNPEKYVKIYIKKGRLNIDIEGPWVSTILFEVKILAIISEVYSSSKADPKDLFENAKVKLFEKIKYMKKFGNDQIKFSEFGTRRRQSFEWQDFMVKTLKEELPNNLIGTSNVYLSIKHDITCMGTMAHEYLMAHQAIYGLYNFQKIALDNWNQEYRGNLGIALTDTINTESFFKEFDKGHAKLYDGLRQDSGDTIKDGWDMVKGYRRLGVDPSSKAILFSNGLDFKEMIDLYDIFSEVTNPGFGCGTFLSFDNDLVKALSIVIKMVKCQGLPVCKISNDKGKNTSVSQKYLEYVKEVFDVS